MKTAFVTGAGRNIGFAIGEAFAAAGYNVTLNARSQAAIEAAAEQLADHPGEVIGLAGDVGVRADVARMVAETERRLGPVDILVNCAAVRVHRPFVALSAEEWNISLQVGLTGAFNCTQAVIGGMQERGWGRVINVAGVTGQTGAANRAGVVTTKAGLIGLTRALALEFAATGVTVNAISPGMIATERGEWTSLGDQGHTASHYEERMKKIPVRRMGRLDEVTAAADYLASERAGFVTGQTLNLNGGMYLG